jgi:glycosyltransferase involved in cell wall biosynthesis
VVKTAAWLRKRGVDAHVDLVGERVPLPYRALPYVHAHGHLSAHDSEQEKLLAELFKMAHFVFIPSRAEAYGMTFCEANAFGLPVIATATGGISEIIREGVNGTGLSLSAGPKEYGEWIEEAIASPERYRAFGESSFREFETRLNWGAHCRTFIERIREVIV